MVVRTVYIARHGYRANWIIGAEVPPPPTGIAGDVQLAQHGIKQAHELGRFLLTLDDQPEMIFSSPFYRCLETSTPIAELLEVPVYIERGFSEWYRPDRPVIPVPADNELLSKYFHDTVRLEWHSQPAPNEKGETEEELYKRCHDALNNFIKQVEKKFPSVETIMIVTHGATKIALGLNLLQKPDCRCTIDDTHEYLRCGSCSLDKFELPSNAKETSNPEEDIDVLEETEPLKRNWMCTLNGHTEFLSRGEEMNWGFHLNVEAGSDADVKSRITTETAGKESVYVSVDIPSGNYKGKNVLDKKATLQYSGLEEHEPLVLINNKLYVGKWEKLVGTELAFPSTATVNKKNLRGGEDDESSSKGLNHILNEDIIADEFDNIKKEEDDKLAEDSDDSSIEKQKIPEERNELENKVTEKIYRIKDRLVLEEVEII